MRKTVWLVAAPLILGAGIAAYFRMDQLKDFFDYAVWGVAILGGVAVALSKSKNPAS